MNPALFRYLARRFTLPCALCAVLPILLGCVFGLIWPDWRTQINTMGGLVKMVRSLLGSEFLDLASPAGFFQIPFGHPLTILALIVAMALPTLSLPAAARERWLDLLLASGLTRGSMVRTVALFSVPFALLMGAAPLTGIFLGAGIANVTSELPFARYACVAFETTLLGLFFAGAGLLLSVATADFLPALMRLFLVVLWSLFGEIIGTLWKGAHFLKFTSPFGFYEPAQVIAGVAHYARDCSILGGGAMLLFTAAVMIEQRRKSV